MKRVWRIALIAVLGLAAIVLAYFAQYGWLKDGWPLDKSKGAGRTVNVSPVSRILISEIMSSNRTAHAGAGGLYADWVELYNSGDSPVDITGWTLTDNADSAIKFTFPEHVMQSGECVLVYLTDTLQNTAGLPYQAPFKLSSTGDALMLYDGGGFIMEALNVPELPSDTSYARVGSVGDFIITKLYTPGLVNTNDSYRSQTTSEVKSDAPLKITRVMPSNRSFLADDDGAYSDWVEIHNYSASSVDLAGFGLSDDLYDRFKWRFPEMTLAPDERVIIFCSGTAGRNSTGFRLSAQGESVILCDAEGNIVDTFEFGYSQPDQVWTK